MATPAKRIHTYIYKCVYVFKYERKKLLDFSTLVKVGAKLGRGGAGRGKTTVKKTANLATLCTRSLSLPPSPASSLSLYLAVIFIVRLLLSLCLLPGAKSNWGPFLVLTPPPCPCPSHCLCISSRNVGVQFSIIHFSGRRSSLTVKKKKKK